MKFYLRLTLVAALLLLGAAGVLAQDDTTDTTTTDTTAQTTPTGPTNSIDILFVACADQAVINVSGFAVSGYDVYYQIFSGPGGTGTAATGLRQIQVDGNYAFSERVGFAEGVTIGEGGVGSARVRVSREGSPDSTDFDTTVDDTQDGCNTPTNPEGTSVDLGGAGTGAAAPEPGGQPVKILTPGGGTLNPNLQPEDLVQIGARPSDRYRSETPGLIFAECDEYVESALPGIIYNTDNVVVFWSWFAKDLETLGQHIENSNYYVKMNGAPMPNATGTAPELINGDYWIFYTVPVGNLRPGHYEIEFRLDWDQPISDGYDNFGPGTATEQVASQCNFDVVLNPVGGSPVYTEMYVPSDYPVHDIIPQY